VRDEGSVTQTPLVLGAGPAGCGAAIALARDGTPPCIIERTRETGDALCGGFLSWQTLAQLDRLGVTGLGAHPISRVRVCYRNKIATARLPNLAGGVSRHRLDSVMQSVAVKAGAMLERGVTARSYAGGVLHTDGGDRTAEALFLASGKHDVRGFGRPKPLGDAPMGLRFRIATHPTLRALIDDSIELHLFDGGYAGLLLQEDGSANLCMALRKSRFAEAGGDAATLLRQLGEEHPRLGERLAFASSMPGADAIAAVPYGWRVHETEAGLFRLGDQAAVIPSLAGEGMGIAIASGAAAAAAFRRGGAAAAPAFQQRFAVRTHRPVAVASFLWHRGERPAMARIAIPLLHAFPALAGFAARLTRIGDR
jgi:flavin-dependent dehydrogenase